MWLYIAGQADEIREKQVTAISVREWDEAIEIAWTDTFGRAGKVMLRDKVTVKLGVEKPEEP